MKPQYEQHDTIRSRRPSGNGSPAWLKAMLVENWADRAFPMPISHNMEKCNKCDAITTHTVQRICKGVVHKCTGCGIVKMKSG